MNNELYLLVVGCREYYGDDEYKFLSSKIDNAVKMSGIKNPKVTLVFGDARGVDKMAKQYAIRNKFEYKCFRANWGAEGKAAGYNRNRKMHEFISTKQNRMCVMFWDGESKGTKQSFGLAKEFNNQIYLNMIG